MLARWSVSAAWYYAFVYTNEDLFQSKMKRFPLKLMVLQVLLFIGIASDATRPAVIVLDPTGSLGAAASEEVSFQWKNPDFLSRNPDFLSRNPDFLSRNPDFLSRNPDFLSRNPDFLSRNPDFLLNKC